MTQIAVMCGATCAIVRVLTTSAYSSGSWTLYYKRSADSTYSSVSLQRYSNLHFISSSWSAEVYGLSAQTTYQFYVVAGSESNHITANTCSLGVFRYSLGFADGTDPTTYSSQYTFLEALLEEFKTKMIGIGFNIDSFDSSWTPSFLLDASASSSYTEDVKGAIHMRTSNLVSGNEPRIRFTIAHEFRHALFLDYDMFLDYASDAPSERLPQTQTGMDNFYKILSFHSCNGNQREVYAFYGENTATESQTVQYLFTLFELKAFGLNCDNAYITE